MNRQANKNREYLRTTLLFISILVLTFSGIASAKDLDKTLLLNLNIVDVENSVLLKKHSVLIAGDKILAISDDPKDFAQQATTTIDLAGYYALPGLFDMHVHLATSPSSYDNIEDVKKRLSFLAKKGVTGVRDMAGDVRQLSYLARQAMLDEITAPDIYYSALISGASFFSDPRTHASAKGLIPGQVPWMRQVTDSSDFQAVVAEAAGTGASGLKLYGDLTGEQARQVINAAQKIGLPTWGHAAVIPVKPRELVDAGISSVSHASLLAWSSNNQQPTAATARYSDFEIDLQNPVFNSVLDDMAAKNIYLDATITTFADHNSEFVYSNGIKAAKAAFQKGVPFVVGTDNRLNYWADYPSLIDEMLFLQSEIGLSAMQVIQAATLNSAKLLNIDARSGSIAPGKKANLVIVQDNPVTDLATLKKVKMTFKNGKLID